MEVRGTRPYEHADSIDRVEVDGAMRNVVNQLEDAQNRLVEVMLQAKNGEDLSGVVPLFQAVNAAFTFARDVEWTVHSSHGAHA